MKVIDISKDFLDISTSDAESDVNTTRDGFSNDRNQIFSIFLLISRYTFGSFCCQNAKNIMCLKTLFEILIKDEEKSSNVVENNQNFRTWHKSFRAFLLVSNIFVPLFPNFQNEN